MILLFALLLVLSVVVVCVGGSGNDIVAQTRVSQSGTVRVNSNATSFNDAHTEANSNHHHSANSADETTSRNKRKHEEIDRNNNNNNNNDDADDGDSATNDGKTDEGKKCA
jgi:hypothetical protein